MGIRKFMKPVGVARYQNNLVRDNLILNERLELEKSAKETRRPENSARDQDEVFALDEMATVIEDIDAENPQEVAAAEGDAAVVV